VHAFIKRKNRNKMGAGCAFIPARSNIHLWIVSSLKRSSSSISSRLCFQDILPSHPVIICQNLSCLAWLIINNYYHR
jgi:hypothetical protein